MLCIIHLSNNNIAKLAELSLATGIGRSQMTTRSTAWVEIGNSSALGIDLNSDNSNNKSQLRGQSIDRK